MALSGSPAITDPRTQDRPTQQAISNIRQRIELIEAALNSTVVVANASLNNQSTSSATLAALTAAVTLLQSQVAALATGTQFYLDGVLVGSRSKVNFHSTADILVTMQDQPGLGEVDIWFTIPVYARPAPGTVGLSGFEPGLLPATATPDAGEVALAGWEPTVL